MKIRKNYKQGLQFWTMLYLSCMFLVFPLYFQNNYINILEAKTAFFKTITYIYIVVGIAIIWFISVLDAEVDGKKRKNTKRILSESKPFQVKENIWMMIFISVLLLATSFSGNISNAWYSPDGKYFGTEIILLCCAAYCLISKGRVKSRLLYVSFVLGCGNVFALTILNRYGFDPLHMYSNLVESQKGIYVSTIGNVNIVSNYVCVFLPVFAGIFICTQSMKMKCTSAIMYMLALVAGICTNSDSFFLGAGSVFLFFLCVSAKEQDKLKNYLLLGMLSICAIKLLALWDNRISYDCNWQSMQEFLIHQIEWHWILLILILIFMFVRNFGDKIPYAKVQSGVLVLLGIAVIGFSGYVLKLNLEATGSETGILIFNDSWGTNRGFVWKRTLILFRELPFHQKLIGIGPGGFKELFAEYNVERINNSLLPFVDLHSEMLYYLISTGILGVISYFGMIVSAIKKCFREQNEKAIVLIAVFISWIAQGTVNNPIVLTTPFLFLFLGMSCWSKQNA